MSTPSPDLVRAVRLFVDASRNPTSILVVGDLMLDSYVWGSVTRISPEAPVPVVNIERTTHTAGGAANAAVCCAALGATVDLVGVVGIDSAGDELENLVSSQNVRPRFYRSDMVPTTVKKRVWSGGQQLLRLDEELPVPTDVTKQLHEEHASRIADYSASLVSDYSKGVVTRETFAILAQECKRADIPLVVDPKAVDLSLYKGATVIKPNEREAIAGYRFAKNQIGSTAEIARYLVAEIASSAVLTLGGQGMLVAESDSLIHVPGEPQNVFDVTGAGDVVAAVLVCGVGRGLGLPDAAIVANAAGRISVGRVGTGPVTLADLQELVQ
jgi:rfaE bifunctional protein kinase chain/domain